MKDLSVIIVNYNTKAMLEECLTSFDTLLSDQNIEVIIVDNCSSDGSPDLVRLKFPAVKLVVNSDNKGFGTANNQGMKIATGRYFLLLNSDTIVTGEALLKALALIKSDAAVGVLGCRLVGRNGDLQLSAGRSFTLFHAIFGGESIYKLFSKVGLRKCLPAAHIFDKSQLGCKIEADWVSGAFMLMPRNVFDETSGFDENIFMYGEEQEWCFRIKKAGYKVVYDPSVEIIHVGKVSSNKANLNVFMQVADGMSYQFRKHHGKAKVFAYRNILFFSAFFKFLFWFAVYMLTCFNQKTLNKMVFQKTIIEWYFRSK